jgi:serine/threonine-protein kinase
MADRPVQVPSGTRSDAGYGPTYAGTSVEAAAPGAHKICPTCGTRHPDHFRVCPQDGATLIEADEIVGTTLAGTYLVERILGDGGMGRVYAARHARIPSKRFALKTLHPELCEQPAILARFHREAEAVAAVRSAHVVGVYDLIHVNGRPFIVGELLDGKELGDALIEAGRLSVGVAARIVRQLCKGLSAAHAMGVVHRDMKPENVFLTGDPTHPIPKILDFGISKVADKPGLTRTGMIMGTPSYMAPEQARGDRVDHRADIYAAGAILYRALTGQPPFDRDDPSATLVAVLSEEPPRPSSLNPEIPADLEVVMQRAMAKAPDERYATIDDFYRALAPFDEGEPAAPLPSAGAASPNTQRGAPGVTTRAPEIGPALRWCSALGVMGVIAIAVTFIAGALRVARGEGAALPGAQGSLLLLGAAFAVLGTAAIAYYVRRRIRGDDARMARLERRISGPVILGLGAYGLATLLVQLMETVLLRTSVGLAWPVWDVLLAVIGAGAAAGALAFQWRQRIA